LLGGILRADQSVTLAWDPNPEPDVSGYKIHYGNASRNYPYSTNVGNVTTATVYGLQEGLVYFFAVTAHNTSGLESDYSNEVTNSIPTDVTNTAPTIKPLEPVAFVESTTTNITINIWDIETNPKNLIVTAVADNLKLFPEAPLITGTNHVRNMLLAPVAGESGQAQITVTVSDGAKASSTVMAVYVMPIPKIPLRLVFISNLQVSDAPYGPWTNILSTHLPVYPGTNTQLFYRTWMDVE